MIEWGMHKFRYLIFPDRLYTITVNGQTIEIMGEKLIKMVLDNPAKN